MENIFVMAALNLPAKDERYHKDWLLQNQARCIHLYLMKWLEGGTVSITAMVRGGGGGVGAHSIEIGEGAFHLRWWGKQSLHTMLKKRKPYSFFRLPCLALAFLNSESLRYS